MTKPEVHVAYNLKVGRSGVVVAAELRALVREYQPATLTYAEGNGYNLPKINGYTGHRDRSSEGRANVGIYVRDDIKARVRWTDLRQTFPRKHHGGTHWARSLLTTTLRGCLVDQLVGIHVPPDWPGAGAARAEYVAAVERVMAPWTRKGWQGRAAKWLRIGRRKHRVGLLDFNGMRDVIARRVGAHSRSGDQTNAAIGRNLKVHVEKVATAAGVPLRSDHEALIVTVTL